MSQFFSGIFIRFRIQMVALVTVVVTFINPVLANEGMWIPSTLAKLVMGDMQDAGLQLSADEIYSINQSSLKDAIVLFGGGCTAEVISNQGLILTNHHCGYSQIQYHSSIENDYLRDGFWAKNHKGELVNPSLTATFVVRIEDVTEQLRLAGENLEGNERSAAMAKKAIELQEAATKNNHYKAEIKTFFYGNAFYLIVTETFQDVRLVGAPPSSIGKFGGDTDNWEWPRHTGDFSLFRIYAGMDNMPAPYSEMNVPYKPKHSLPINMDGIREGEFTMVFGFPGRTEQFLTSDAVRYVLDEANPARIAMRKASLSVIDRSMADNDTIRIQYAAKQSRISNAYKKWIGQSMGLKKFNALDKKVEFEETYALAAKVSGRETYADAIPALARLYERSNQYALARDYLIEFFYYGPEALRFSREFNNIVANYDSLEQNGLIEKEIERLGKAMDGFFKNYNALVDERIMAVQAPIFSAGAPEILQPPTLSEHMSKNAGEGMLAAREIYKNSVYHDRAALEALLARPGKRMVKKLSQDPIYKISDEILIRYRTNVSDQYDAFRYEEDILMGTYVKGIMELMPDKNYWPDANSTLRLSFGKAEGSEPMDGLVYKSYTTLDGIVEKYVPGDVEFDLPQRLLDLHRDKDYGPYATEGELRVCFLGSNHTTGGNSGSPALNAKGELVGLNFDRTWESTMSDIMFNGEICRNIMVDIKYVLFIIDKYAEAVHLIDEMELVIHRVPQAVELPEPVMN
jgi:hypothetical protein